MQIIILSTLINQWYGSNAESQLIQLDLSSLYGTIQLHRLESEAGDSLLANEPFTAQSQAWLRSTDKWLDLYVPVQALRRMSGQYSCYAESLYFYQQQTPATHAVIKWTWLWAFMGTCKCSDTCTCMYNLGQTRMSKVQLLLLVG